MKIDFATSFYIEAVGSTWVVFLVARCGVGVFSSTVIVSAGLNEGTTQKSGISTNVAALSVVKIKAIKISTESKNLVMGCAFLKVSDITLMGNTVRFSMSRAL